MQWIGTRESIADPVHATARNAGILTQNGKLVSSYIVIICINVYLQCLIHNFFSWLARTDPADVARVESRTFVVTPKRSDAIPNRMEGVNGQLGNWMSPDDLHKAIQDRFPNCKKGTVCFFFTIDDLREFLV